jgi:Icc-related predicted phosphoesterase
VVVTLGDLQPSWIEPLERLRKPKVGVYGNHDDEPYMDWYAIDDLHLRRLDLDQGLSFCGFEGCVSYPRSSRRVGPSYSQRQARKLVRKLPQADVLLCHCPPRGVNDDEDDPAHVGFDGLRDWMIEHRPRLVLHGHTHPQPGRIAKQVGETRVAYVNGARVVEL